MKPSIRLPLIYGAIGAALGLAFFVLLFYLNRHPLLIPVFLDSRIFLFAVFMFLLLRELREVYYDGILYFWQGLITGVFFLGVFAGVSAISIVIFAWLEPEFVPSYIALKIAEIKTYPSEVVAQIGKDVVESNLKMLPSTNANQLAMMYFSQCFMIGLFLNIIIAVISRRTPKN